MKKRKNSVNKYANVNTNLAASMFSGFGFFNLNRNLAAFNPNVKLLLLLVLGSLLVGLAHGVLFKKLAFDVALTPAVITAASCFFSYLIARELDPDRVKGAYIGGFCALIFSMLWGLPNLVILFWLLMLLRMFSRTSGAAAGLLDNLLILIAAFWLVREGQWIYAAITALVYAAESQMPAGNPRSLYAAGFAFLIASFAPQTNYLSSNIPADMFAVVIVAVILFVPVIKAAEHVRSCGDHNGLPLSHLRLQLSQIFTVLMAFGMTWFYGQQSLLSFMPVWAAILGVGVYLPIALVLKN